MHRESGDVGAKKKAMRGWRRERGKKEIGGEQGCRKGEQGGGNKEGSGKRRYRGRRIIGKQKWN